MPLPLKQLNRLHSQTARIPVISSGILALLFLSVVALPGRPAQNEAGVEQACRGVAPAQVYEFCKRLAGPEFAGRLTGSEGYDAMSRWAAGLLRDWGLKPLDDSGYLQAFPTEYTAIESAAMTVWPGQAGSPGKEIALEAGKDFLPLLFSDTADRTTEAVFVGWGISAPELGYDDYAGVDVRGKFALCFRGTPDPANRAFTGHDEHRTRMRKASERGALGIIYIYDEPLANPNGDWIRGFTPAIIGSKAADRILEARGIRSAALRDDLLKYRRPISFATGTRVRYAVRSTHIAEAKGFNVAGILPGSDPVLRQEYVIVGAHADHCGRLMGLLFPGANDNASGTATVLEIARALAGATQRPKRSIVIALFGGEESGLKGSEYLARHLPQSLAKPLFMLNFDMVGEGDAIRCGYSDQPALKQLVDEIPGQVGAFKGGAAIRSIGVQSSDFAPFFQKGIACISFSSNGPHLSYHQPGDSIYRINPDIMADAARIGVLAAYKLADR